jgi:hypothetical protein
MRVPGLQSKFPTRACGWWGWAARLPSAGRRRTSTLQIAERDIQPEDIELLDARIKPEGNTSTTLERAA